MERSTKSLCAGWEQVHDSRHFIRNYFARPALRSYLEGAFISVVSVLPDVTTVDATLTF